MSDMLKELLKEGASAAQVELTDEQLDKFEKYYEYLIEKNKVMNLTAITDEREVVYKHFVDSIALIPKMDFKEKKIIDVGTGAGFPGNRAGFSARTQKTDCPLAGHRTAA